MIWLTIVALAGYAPLVWLLIKGRSDLREANDRLYSAWKDGAIIPEPTVQQPIQPEPADPFAQFTPMMREYIQSFEGNDARRVRLNRALRMKAEGKSEHEIISILDAPQFM